ncbi:hypothetical protein ACIQV3_29625 [Streptomyces sp. NPDC099050]|uniref:hypothetical protein n=1 Tax=Streptomyces sp. NPDC099050 TaxID=3366100 RepID=UPI0038090451
MQLPAEAVSATALIEVVRLTAPPRRSPSGPFTGDPVALWAGAEARTALSLAASLPDGVRHRCGFHPGWAMRAYEDHLAFALFEAQFCFRCHEVRLHGPAVPPRLTHQLFAPESPAGRALLALFRATASAPAP